MNASHLIHIGIFCAGIGLPLGCIGAVFGHDDRIPFEEAVVPGSTNLLNSSGSIECFDGSMGSGFIVDISEYVDGEQDFYIVATSAQVLYRGETGEARGRCAFVPAMSPGNRLELRDRLYGHTRVSNADSNDWAYARIDKHVSGLESLPVAFGDVYDFRADIPLEIWTTGVDPRSGRIAVTSNCNLDDKSIYSGLWQQKDDLSRMVLHDCDVASGSRGGPLAYLSDGQFFAIAINAGDGGGKKFPSLSGIPYDPQRRFHNFSRRFDEELEGKLVAFVSRFAHIKDPSPTVRAYSELIRNVQSELTRLGYDAGPIDGLLGSKTREAIQAFQTTLNITPNGRVSEEVLLLLRNRE
jgi:hypothetical protein